MVGKAHAWNRKPAGKHPALRPKATALMPAPKISKPARAHKQTRPAKTAKTVQAPWQTASRRIITRSQGKIFRLLDLPPELRNLVYHNTARNLSSEAAIDLTTLKLPLGLSPTRQVREEILPFFFLSNHFKVRVTSNFCVFRRHFHQLEHVGYLDAGKVALSPVLMNRIVDGDIVETTEDHSDEDDEGIALADKLIRFKRVTFEIDCVCCTPGKTIARLELSMKVSQATVDCTMVFNPARGDLMSKASIELIFADVRMVVEKVGSRKGFNGFTVADLVTIGQCASYEENEVDEPSSEGHGL